MVELRYHEIPKAFSIYLRSEINLFYEQSFVEPFQEPIGFGIPLEIRIAFKSNGFRVILNGHFIRTVSYVIKNGEYPVITTLEWSDNDEIRTTRVYWEEGILLNICILQK